MNKKGIYIHVPFCKGKCPYCDFYSVHPNEKTVSDYVQAVTDEMKLYSGLCADTIYIGGGTPSVLSGENTALIIEQAKKTFNFTGGEITVEVNPSSCTQEFIEQISEKGANRISIGLQSSCDGERKLLGRRADAEKVSEVISFARKNGIRNISLDVMLGIPGQTKNSLLQTLTFCVNSGANHISSYILKIEPGTYYDLNRHKYSFPDEELCCELYEQCCDFLESNGFLQYEISNFSKPGFESRHNLKYWNCEEYIGIGPSSHSFLGGKRFYHPSDIDSYIGNCRNTVPDGDGGSFEEYAMLRLRLTDGLCENELMKKFGFNIPENIRKNCDRFQKNGFLVSDKNGIRLTKKGFLISNYIISELLLN